MSKDQNQKKGKMKKLTEQNYIVGAHFFIQALLLLKEKSNSLCVTKRGNGQIDPKTEGIPKIATNENCQFIQISIGGLKPPNFCSVGLKLSGHGALGHCGGVAQIWRDVDAPLKW